MYKRFFILTIFCLFLQNFCLASEVFDYPQSVSVIVKEIPQLNSISCKFTQEKHFQNSNSVIKSRGNFKFLKGQGVFFETTYPIHSVTSYTTSDYKQINSVIKAISAKSYSKIERQFQLYYRKKSSYWELGLVPKKMTKTAKYLKYIDIEGSKDISKITILTKNGVKTIIYFYQK